MPAHSPPATHNGLVHYQQIRIYQDEDGARKEEIAQLRHGASDNVFRQAPATLRSVLAENYVHHAVCLGRRQHSWPATS
jgi:hypothetical protein